MKESLGGLMDEAVPPETLARIREIISANADGAIEAHDLRTRHAGRMMFIDFHLVVPSGMVAARIWGDSAPERVPHPVIF
jgi:divalent metal cation (Fe/Co/Zn/Cd) transporter